MNPGARQCLLLVDADPQSLRVLDVSLKKAGYDVMAAQGGAEALALLAEHPIDLVISDTHMPQMDGFELCRRIKEHSEWARIPFIFLSSRKTIEDKIRGLEIGVEDYLIKPVYIKEITTRVRMLLQRRERERLESKRDTRTRFAGDLSDIGVIDLVQTVEVNRKSGIVHIGNADGRRGAIYFRDGQVIDAEAGRLTGLEAVYRLFAWNEGNFEVEFKNVRRRDVIEMSAQTLLMEGMRRLDEWTRLLETLPALETAFEVDYYVLAERLADIPDEVNAILRLFDGRRSLMQVIEDSDFPDLDALSIISRLHADHVIYEAQGVRPEHSEVRQTRMGRLERWLSDSPWVESEQEDGTPEPLPSDTAISTVPGDFGDVKTTSDLNDLKTTPVAGIAAEGAVHPLPTRPTSPGFAPGRFTPPPPSGADEVSSSSSHLKTTAGPLGVGAQPAQEMQGAPEATEQSSLPADDSDGAAFKQRPEDLTPALVAPEGSGGFNVNVGRGQSAESDAFFDAPTRVSGTMLQEVNDARKSESTLLLEPDDIRNLPSAASTPPDPAHVTGSAAGKVRRAGSARIEADEEDTFEEVPTSRRKGAILFAAALFVGIAAAGLVLRNRTVRPVAPPVASAPSEPSMGAAGPPESVERAPAQDERLPRVDLPQSAPEAARVVPEEPGADPAVTASGPAASTGSGGASASAPVAKQGPPAPSESAPAPVGSRGISAASTGAPAPAPPVAQDKPGTSAKPAAPTAGEGTARDTANPPPDNVVAACRSAYASERYRAIIDNCGKALQIKPSDASLMAMLAHAELDRGHGAAALRWARKAVSVDPKFADAYVFIGEVEQEQGNVAAAKSAYAKYLELAPKGRYASDLRVILSKL